MKSTIQLLKNVNEIELINAINKENYYQGVLEEAKNKGKIEGIKEGKIEGIKERKIEGRKEGKIEGRKEGIIEGRKEGKIKETIEIMINFYNHNEKFFEENIDNLFDKKITFNEDEIKKNTKGKIFNINGFINLLKKKRRIKII